MGFLKRRPGIKLRLPQEIRPGGPFSGEVILEASRPVPLESLTVSLRGKEWAEIGQDHPRLSRTLMLVEQGGVLSGPTELAAGATRYRVSFQLPGDAPPSYRGVAAGTEYTIDVHAAIPWWPDAKENFEVIVLPPPRLDDRPGRAQLFSSAPGGPDGEEAYVEGSLGASVMAAGDCLSGAVALGNVRSNRYKNVTVALIAWQSLLIDHHRDEREVARYQLVLPVDHPGELAPIRFDLRVPQDELPATSRSHLWEVRWFFEVKAEVRWGSDVILRVPVTLLPRPPGSDAGAERTFAPPSVGSERVQALWRETAKELGLTYQGEAIRGRTGGLTTTEFSIHREHRGKAGVHLVALLRYPSLGLDLEIARQQRLLGGARGVPLGDRVFDKKYRVRLREPAQAEAFAASVLPALKGFATVTADDTGARLEQKDSGQSPRRLRAFVERVSWLARALVAVRVHLPPPEAFQATAPAWRALAERLKGQLHAGGMAILGELDGLPIEVRTCWSDGVAEATLLVVRAEAALLDAPILLEADEAGTLALPDDLPLPADARGLLRGLADGARRLRLEGREATITLAPALDPGPLLPRLETLRKLVVHLRPGGVGPYR